MRALSFLASFLLSSSLFLLLIFVLDLFESFHFFRWEKKINLIEKLWVKPCEKIISWGWNKRSFQKNVAKIVRFGSNQIGINDRVRIVAMNGCMAHTRDNVREGVVIGFETKPVLGSGGHKHRYAKIRLDNGEILERCAESRFWSVYEGLSEYQE